MNEVLSSKQTVLNVKSGIGIGVTVTFRVVLSEHPLSSVTVSPITYVPIAVYAFSGLCMLLILTGISALDTVHFRDLWGIPWLDQQ